MEDYIVFNLYKFIESRGLSVRRFEEMAGITQGVIAKAIKNKTSFSVSNLQKIATAFPDLDINWLIKAPPELENTKPDETEKALQDMEGFRA